MSKTPTNPSIITRDVDKIAAKTGNVYESISIVGQRARQISSKMKEELSGKFFTLKKFISSVINFSVFFLLLIFLFLKRFPKKYLPLPFIPHL